GSANVIFTPPSIATFTQTLSAAWAAPAAEPGVQVTLPTPTGSCALEGTGIAVATQTSTTGVSGTRQRLLIEVPNPAAQLTIGARTREPDRRKTFLEGLGLGRVGNGSLTASGEGSSLWLRAMKSLVLEARASAADKPAEGIWMVSNGNIAASSAGTASFI